MIYCMYILIMLMAFVVAVGLFTFMSGVAENNELLTVDESLTPIENALYATERFTTEQCTQLAEGILLYLDDENIGLHRKTKDEI